MKIILKYVFIFGLLLKSCGSYGADLPVSSTTSMPKVMSDEVLLTNSIKDLGPISFSKDNKCLLIGGNSNYISDYLGLDGEETLESAHLKNLAESHRELYIQYEERKSTPQYQEIKNTITLELQPGANSEILFNKVETNILLADEEEKSNKEEAKELYSLAKNQLEYAIEMATKEEASHEQIAKDRMYKKFIPKGELEAFKEYGICIDLSKKIVVYHSKMIDLLNKFGQNEEIKAEENLIKEMKKKILTLIDQEGKAYELLREFEKIFDF